MRALLARIDRFSLMLLATVAIASLLPPQGGAALAFRWITMACIALLFFLHGAKLSRSALIDGAGNWRLHATVLAITFVMFPVLGLGLHEVAVRTVAPDLAAGMLFLTLLSSTVQSSIAFTAMARGNVPAAVCSAALSNVVGIAATPLLVALLMGRTAGTISITQVESIVLQLLLPFVAGHLSRPLTAGFVARHRTLTSAVDRGSILLVVYTAFGAAVIEGLWTSVPAWQIAVLLVLCGILLAVVLLLSRTIARAAGFDTADEIAILFCGSKKSLASGVPMAGVLFPAATVGAVILPVMLFHQIQLVACAVIAQRYARRPIADVPEAVTG